VKRGVWDLEGSIAVVTGALGNLGPVWAAALLEAGASVVGLDLPEAKMSDTFAELQDRHRGRLRLVRGDVTDRSSLVEARSACREAAGRATILVNNAGIDAPPAVLQRTHAIEDLPAELSRAVFEVNTLGTLQATQVFGTDMVEARRGSIVNVASLYAAVAPDQRFYDHIEPTFLKPPAYGASKAAVVSLTKYFATLWGPFGVRVNAISPGGVLGGQDEQFKAKYAARVPMGRMALPADLAGPLVFLASDASRYVTGVNLMVDGGFTAW
jgi:NAD(P)-dependent dehydrogenase (short-subunit alcohol dehydrogenase family)